VKRAQLAAAVAGLRLEGRIVQESGLPEKELEAVRLVVSGAEIPRISRGVVYHRLVSARRMLDLHSIEELLDWGRQNFQLLHLEGCPCASVCCTALRQ
jgi:hypothetical protein